MDNTPVFDATVAILTARNVGLTNKNINAVHASLLEIYAKEPLAEPSTKRKKYTSDEIRRIQENKQR